MAQGCADAGLCTASSAADLADWRDTGPEGAGNRHLHWLLGPGYGKGEHLLTQHNRAPGLPANLMCTVHMLPQATCTVHMLTQASHKEANEGDLPPDVKICSLGIPC